MSNTNWEKQELAALFTIAEDIDRFDPWESNVAQIGRASCRERV